MQRALTRCCASLQLTQAIGRDSARFTRTSPTLSALITLGYTYKGIDAGLRCSGPKLLKPPETLLVCWYLISKPPWSWSFAVGMHRSSLSWQCWTWLGSACLVNKRVSCLPCLGGLGWPVVSSHAQWEPLQPHSMLVKLCCPVASVASLIFSFFLNKSICHPFLFTLFFWACCNMGTGGTRLSKQASACWAP